MCMGFCLPARALGELDWEELDRWMEDEKTRPPGPGAPDESADYKLGGGAVANDN
jgi:hypothetical protein